MADPPPVAPDPEHHDRTAGMPRWVKVTVAAALATALVFAVALLTRPGDHGPGRHTPVLDEGVHATHAPGHVPTP